MPLTLAEFVNRWKINALSERSGAQTHFIDLCAILREPHPAAAQPQPLSRKLSSRKTRPPAATITETTT